MEFDSSITALLHNHKLKTADEAQVCNGSSWKVLGDTFDILLSPPSVEGVI